MVRKKQKRNLSEKNWCRLKSFLGSALQQPHLNKSSLDLAATKFVREKEKRKKIQAQHKTNGNVTEKENNR